MTKSQKTQSRPPIVAVLGHVDHGKTSLLDYIRKAHVQAREAGGITQGIGAYQAEFSGNPITFIDTPGHAAFREMRSRGANVADLAVLVIAADDGVKPQTEESIKHLQDAKTPFIVAINKMDKPGVTADLAKAELTKFEVYVEGYGGNTPVVELSAKTGKGVSDLLENILLLAELEELPLKSDATLQAPVIEAKKHMKKGIIVSVVVKEGTFQVGDDIMTITAAGKVKALFDAQGKSVKLATPGLPVQIMGFKSLPVVGEIVTLKASSEAVSDELQEEQEIKEPLENKLNILLKADSLGSLQAIKNSLAPEVNIITEGTGDITDADIMHATSTGAIILGFAVKVNPRTLKLAETDKVIVKTYRIIYELLEYLEKKVLRLLEPTIDEEELGVAKVIKLFEINKDLVVGCSIESGKVSTGDTIHLKKKDGSLKNARIKSLRIGKEEVKEVGKGKECGILTYPKLDIKEKDTIIAYKKTKTDD